MSNPTAPRFPTGPLLRHARVAAGVSAADVADAVHLSASYWAHVEAGRKRPDDRTVTRAIEYLAGRVTDMHRRNLLIAAAGTAGAVAVPAAESLTGLVDGALAAGAPATRDAWEQRLTERFTAYLADVGRCALDVRADLGDLRAQGDPARFAAITARVAALRAQTGGGEEVERWWLVADAAADQSGELAVRTWTAGRGALDLAYDVATLPRAAQLADKALALAEGRTVSAGLVHALFARAHIDAALGHASAVDRLHEAIDAAEGLDATDTAPSAMGSGLARWQTWLGAAHLAAKTGQTTLFASMREAFEADAPADRSRFGAHMRMYEALLLAGLGEAEVAAEVAEAAWREVPTSNRSGSLAAMRAELVDAA
jgi:transcriptional regulator with XRE-family HTH domain